MANGSQHNLALKVESTWGTTPSNPVFQKLRNTGCTLALTKDSFTSNEIRSDRQITDTRQGASKIGGDINIELSYTTLDEVLEAVLLGTWTPLATITATTISAASADNSYNDSGTAFVTAGFEVGQQVVVTGFTGDVANNITSGEITALTSGKMTIGGTDGDVIVNDSAGESVTIATLDGELKAGTTRRSFTIERDFSDLASNRYHRFTGCEFNTLSLTIGANKIIEGSVSVLGKDLTLSSSIVSGATYTDPTTTNVMDAFTGLINEGGSEVAVITELTLNLDNGLQPRFVVGDNYTIRPSIGRSKVTGQVTAYFENTTLLNKFINETESSIEVELIDLDGNMITILLPRIKYTGAQPDVTSEGPVTLPMPFEALYDETEESNIVITRNPA